MRTCVDMSTVITVAVMVSSPLLRSALLRDVCIWDRRCASVSSRFHGERLFLFLGSLGAHEALHVCLYGSLHVFRVLASDGLQYIISAGGRST
jgi:hypothetical protein